MILPIIISPTWAKILLVLFFFGAFDMPLILAMGLRYTRVAKGAFRNFLIIILFWLVIYAALYFLVPGLKETLAPYWMYMGIVAVVGFVFGLIIKKEHFEAVADI